MSLTFATFATAKQLPQPFLKEHGIGDLHYGGGMAVRFPYKGEDGVVVAERFRIAMDGKDRFRWGKGNSTCLYGLWRLPSYEAGGAIHLVEGESDCLTLWLHDYPALGVPGVDTWKDAWSTHLERFETVYAWIEPDGAGVNFEAALRTSRIASKLKFIRPSKVSA